MPKMGGKNQHWLHCSVPECRQKLAAGCRISFHHFPKDRLLQKKWTVALKMGEPKPLMRVCSRHFKKDDYVSPGCQRKRPFLKRGSVPRLNLPQSSLPQKKTNPSFPKKRAQRTRALRLPGTADAADVNKKMQGKQHEKLPEVRVEIEKLALPAQLHASLEKQRETSKSSDSAKPPDLKMSFKKIGSIPWAADLNKNRRGRPPKKRREVQVKKLESPPELSEQLKKGKTRSDSSEPAKPPNLKFSGKAEFFGTQQSGLGQDFGEYLECVINKERNDDELMEEAASTYSEPEMVYSSDTPGEEQATIGSRSVSCQTALTGDHCDKLLADLMFANYEIATLKGKLRDHTLRKVSRQNLGDVESVCILIDSVGVITEED